MTGMFPPLCTGQPVDMGDGTLIDGVTDDQHQWTEGVSWDGPGPVGEAPVHWQELVCDRCGVVQSAWGSPGEDR